MVLEGAVKFIFFTLLLAILLFLGWYLSAAYLEPVILKIFKPENHEDYLDYWFATFMAVEVLIIAIYCAFIFKSYYSKKKHLIG